MQTYANSSASPIHHHLVSRTSARFRSVWWAAFLLLAAASRVLGATVQVQVGGSGPEFTPAEVIIRPGDTVQWNWAFVPRGASVTSGTANHPTGLFDSGIHGQGYTFSYTFTTAGRFDYFCRVEPQMMTGVVEVIDSQAQNISTRLKVETGENVMIGGFIISGNEAKKVIIRAIGPSLQQAGLSGVLDDPVLELRNSALALIASNDNWKDTQQSAIEETGIAPQSDFESAIVVTLAPGSYTAIVSGKNGTSGVGLVEVYDLAQGVQARLANISTRGRVQTANNVMIGGFILGNGTQPAKLVVRAIGPSLSQFNISGALADPTLELRDSNGGLVRSNNNWKESQQAEIEASGLSPQHELESAILAELLPGNYTAIVAGNGGGTGVGLVEVYQVL